MVCNWQIACQVAVYLPSGYGPILQQDANDIKRAAPAQEVIVLRISFSPPDISDLEIKYVTDALRSGWITTGPRTKQFERNLSEACDTSMTICLNSATSAMEVALMLFGAGPGDEVITSAYTYTASASVIHHVGAKVVLVDTEPGTYFMDPEQLRLAINERTKAIIPVDIGGVMADYDRIFEVVREARGVFKPATELQEVFGRPLVLADAAHSFGATYHGKPSGSVGDFTAFSFHAVKNLTTAEGGSITWKDHAHLDNSEVYHDLQLLSLHGQNKDALSKLKLGAWEYDIVHPGQKCNMTDIMAALGLAQMKRFPELSKKRFATIKAYDDAFLPLGIESLQHKGPNHQGNGHLYMARVPGINEEQRNEIIARMAVEGVACNVHFKPLPMFTAYKKMGFDIADFPNAYNQYSNEITLPTHTLLSDKDVEYIIKKFKAITAPYLG